MNKAVQRTIKLRADKNGSVAVPDSIHLMSTGHWHTPWHGAFEMTVADLGEMVTNFDLGIGLVEGSSKAPINYGHDQGGKAAGWIVKLRVEGEELWGDIEWTPAGRKALEEGEYRYISPEWNPRDYPWENPQIEGEFVENVFCGAALTNIPLFTKLKPVMASRDAANGTSEIKAKQGEDMDLSEVRVKKLEELTDEEKAFLAEHKEELTDEERQAFELVDDPETPEEPETPEQEEEEAPQEPESPEEPEAAGTPEEPDHIEGAAKPLSITADQLAQLQADAKAGREAKEELLRVRLEASVNEHVNRGAIKADQSTEAVEILMASTDAQRDRLVKFMASLPSNELITNGEIGKDNATDVVPADQLMAKAQERVASSNGKLTLSAAIIEVAKSDPELAKQYETSQKKGA